MEQRIIYLTYNNYKLTGILNKVNDTSDIVIICHARSSSKDSRPTTMLSKELSKNDINNFRFDFIACGESSGDYKEYTVSNMIINLEDTIKMLKQQYNYKTFTLIGCSMGARIVSLIDDKKYSIKKIILWYGALDYGRGIISLPGKKEKKARKFGYLVLENNFKLSYEYFRDERKHSAYKELKKKDIPVLFIHGTKDPYVPIKSSIVISKKCKNSELLLIEDGDHGFHNEKHMKVALEKTLQFIKK